MAAAAPAPSAAADPTSAAGAGAGATGAPRLRVRRATRADALACQEVRLTAFRSGCMSQCMWPGEKSAAAYATSVAGFASEIQQGGTGPRCCHVLVAELLPAGTPADAHDSADSYAAQALAPADGAAADHDVTAAPRSSDTPPRADALLNRETGGTVIAFAKWHLYREPRDEAVVKAPRPATIEEYGEGANLEVCDAFLGGLRAMRGKWIGGSPHFILSLLACSPAYQKRGAASALMRWGTALADREGQTCWLEASPAGYSVYCRAGFVDVATLDLDITGRWGRARHANEDWGANNATALAGPLPGEGWHRSVLMKRVPQAAA